MRHKILLAMWVGALALPLAACNEPSTPAVAEQTFGPSPTLPALPGWCLGWLTSSRL